MQVASLISLTRTRVQKPSQPKFDTWHGDKKTTTMIFLYFLGEDLNAYTIPFLKQFLWIKLKFAFLSI